MTKHAFIVNCDLCSDHRGCMVGCKVQKNAFLGAHLVETYTSMSDDIEHNNTYFVPVMCQHCDNPACMAVCKHDVISKRDDGLVVLGDTDICASCDHPCVAACPYDRVFLDPVTNRIAKCDGCPELVDAGLPPACTVNCWKGAITFADLEDDSAVPVQLLEMAEEAGTVHQLKPEAGTRPTTRYVLGKRKWENGDKLYSPAWHNDEPEFDIQ